jgi:phage/conjugal plasmid C-4 type zinc finger TraR family protein
MDLGERAIERALEFEQRQRDAAVARIQTSLTGLGEEFCIACGERIEEARRIALPSARRCFDCQSAKEAGK